MKEFQDCVVFLLRLQCEYGPASIAIDLHGICPFSGESRN